MDKKTKIRSQVIDIIIDKLSVEPQEVTPEANFSLDLRADSLDIVELIMEFEKEFNVAIRSEVAEKIYTVEEAVKVIEELVAL